MKFYEWCKKNNSKLIYEWDNKKNSNIDIYNITNGSSKKVWWICPKGHSYSRSIYDRIRNRNCPYCSNRKVLTGYNDLATTNPELLREWNYKKNNSLGYYPEKITAGTHKKIWWVCEKGHEWEAIPRSRTVLKCGCPYCSNNKVLKNYNDLFTTNPELVNLWNYKKNKNLNPAKISHGSTKKAWWVCEKGHEWEATISSVARGNRCPICANQLIQTGYNDLATKYPDILQYWDYNKNSILPTQVFSHSNKKVWWTCPKGHSYMMSINAKTRGNYHSCPICNKYKRVSVPEKILLYYLKQHYNNVIENYKPNWLNAKEIDIYIPQISIGIEYDGYRYHSDFKSDLDKDILCEKNGIKLIRIREKECPNYISNSIKICLNNSYSYDYTYINYGLNILSNILNIDIDYDIKRDFTNILKLIEFGDKNNCIAKTNPEILDEWDYNRNDNIGITPYNVTKGTNLKAWWICPKGHHYKSSIAIKTNQHTSCPYCNGRKILTGYNDFQSTHSSLLSEWDYSKNSIKPSEISKWSMKKVWWICPKGHSYESTIANRLNNHNGCPYCSGHKVLTGYNDLVTTHPKLIKEWNYQKNNQLNLYPTKLSKGYDKKVWWICEKGHEWLASINSRTSKKTNCPYCTNKKVLSGYNDLATTNPELLKEWDYDKNNKNNLTPQNVLKGSTKKVWWLCSKGHSFMASIKTKKEQFCPICANIQVKTGYNDLATTNKVLLKYWDYEKNNLLNIFPNKITAGSGKYVYWVCEQGHCWKARIVDVANGKKCPLCKKNK